MCRFDGSSPQVRTQLRKLHEAVRDSVQHRDPATSRIVYGLFSNLSLEQETMRTKGHVSTSELARLDQYLRNTIANFGKLRNVADCRTPVALRAYTQVFLNVFPVLFAPSFALVSSKGWWPAQAH